MKQKLLLVCGALLCACALSSCYVYDSPLSWSTPCPRPYYGRSHCSPPVYRSYGYSPGYGGHCGPSAGFGHHYGHHGRY